MIDLVSQNLKEIRATCELHGVEALWVFGSAVRDDWEPGRSDIDFVAAFGESDHSLFGQHMGLIVHLEEILGVIVQVVDARAIQRADFRNEVEHTRELLYERTLHAISA